MVKLAPESRVELGIQKREGIYFYEPSEHSKELHHYLLWGGEYTCVAPYHVKRAFMEAFLFFWIKEGELHFHYRNQSFTARAGDIVLLDCKYLNDYAAGSEPVRFQWFHFNGGLSQKLLDSLYEHRGALFPSADLAKESATTLFEALKWNYLDQVDRLH